MAGNAVYSGLWDGQPDVNGVAGGHTLQSGRNPLDKKAARVLKRRGMDFLQQAIDTVTTSTSVAGTTLYRVDGSEAASNLGDPAVNGGSVTVNTVTRRSTANATADEVARIDEIVDHDTQPTYPTDAGGNGGGGKGADTAPSLG